MRCALPIAVLLTAACATLAAQSNERSALAPSEAAANHLTVNGAQIEVFTFTTAAPVEEVLDRFAAQCAREARSTTLLRSADRASCLEHARQQYVRAQPTAAGSVHALLSVARDPLNLPAMFPEQGDAAGSDLGELPRPSGARRVLSAQLPLPDQALVAYAARDDAETALARYTRELEQNGFVQLEVAPPPCTTRAFARGEHLYVVHALARGRGSVLSAVRIARDAASPLLAAAGTALAMPPEQ